MLFLMPCCRVVLRARGGLVFSTLRCALPCLDFQYILSIVVKVVDRLGQQYLVQLVRMNIYMPLLLLLLHSSQLH